MHHQIEQSLLRWVDTLAEIRFTEWQKKYRAEQTRQSKVSALPPIDITVEKTDEDGDLIQPSFGARSERTTRQRVQNGIERRKWIMYFEKWGCVCCERRDCGHVGNGFCQHCYGKIRQRIKTLVAEIAREGFDS